MVGLLVTAGILLIGAVVVIGMACARWAARNGRQSAADLVAPDHAEYGWATDRVARVSQLRRRPVARVEQLPVRGQARVHGDRRAA